MLTKFDKFLAAIASSGLLSFGLPLLHGPFDQPGFTAAVVTILTGLSVWLAPNKSEVTVATKAPVVPHSNPRD